MSVKKIYNVEDIIKCGANTREAVSEAVYLVKQFIVKELNAGADGITLGLNANKVFDNAGSEMSRRTFIHGSFDSTNQQKFIREKQKYYKVLLGNEKELKAINLYIFQIAGNQCTGSPSRKIRELLSDEWAHSYVSLIAHKFEEALAK